MTTQRAPAVFLACIAILHVVLGDRVLLSDVRTITLYRGSMTTGRRTSPIPQLRCIGGSAGCSSYTPNVVQCYNRGSDGYDIQWECKADMDKRYRFGRVQVLCEGYDSPSDLYVLKGSCGLEYTLDRTSNYQPTPSYDDYNQSDSFVAQLFSLMLVLFIIYVFFIVCSDSHHYVYDGHGYHYRNDGGFWNGYMLGSFMAPRPYYYHPHSYSRPWGAGSGWNGGGYGGSNMSPGGSRMSSGFGGTVRR